MKDRICLVIHGGAGTLQEDLMDEHLKRSLQGMFKTSIAGRPTDVFAVLNTSTIMSHTI